jgi:SET domain-containing protein
MKQDFYIYNWNNIKKNGYKNDQIFLKESPIHGIGVFASKNFKKGDVVEYCYSMTFDFTNKYIQDPSVERFSLTLSCDCEECYWHGEKIMQGFGYASVYNSSNSEEEKNVIFIPIPEQGLLVVEAYKDILENEELLMWGGQQYYDKWCKSSAK